MSSMDFFGKLLDGVTVEWKPLGEVTSIKTGQSVNKQMISANPGEYPVINSGREPLGFIDEWNTDNDPIGITSRGAGVGSVTWQPGKYFRGNLNYSVTIKNIQLVSTRYLYHLLLEMQPEIQSLCTYDGIPALNAGNLKELLVPIPCPDNPKKSLEIQGEIVRILDAFTSLTAELTAELTARKKQYNHYRDQLLRFDDSEVEWKTLGEVCRFINGRAYKQPELLASGKYPVLRVGNFFTNANWYYSDLELEADKYCDTDDLLYAWSASFGPKIWDGNKVIYHYHIWKVIPNDNLILKKYLYYVLAWDTEALKAEHGTGSTMMHVGKGAIEKRLVPVPSLAEQARIVAILDKFDALTNSITEGLPREIELRQKQYAYYRDLLLSFPKPDEVEA